MKTASILGTKRFAVRSRLIKAFFAWSFIIIMISASPVFAASLWSEESDAIYTKQARKFKVGDLLTLIIVEQASASYNSGTEGEEASDIRVGQVKAC